METILEELNDLHDEIKASLNPTEFLLDEEIDCRGDARMDGRDSDELISSSVAKCVDDLSELIGLCSTSSHSSGELYDTSYGQSIDTMSCVSDGLSDDFSSSNNNDEMEAYDSALSLPTKEYHGSEKKSNSNRQKEKVRVKIDLIQDIDFPLLPDGRLDFDRVGSYIEKSKTMRVKIKVPREDSNLEAGNNIDWGRLKYIFNGITAPSTYDDRASPNGCQTLMEYYV